VFYLALDDFYVSILSALPWFLIEDLVLCGVLLFRGFLLSILGIILLTVLWSTLCFCVWLPCSRSYPGDLHVIRSVPLAESRFEYRLIHCLNFTLSLHYYIVVNQFRLTECTVSTIVAFSKPLVLNLGRSVKVIICLIDSEQRRGETQASSSRKSLHLEYAIVIGMVLELCYCRLHT
jgi:hypothetical protein